MKQYQPNFNDPRVQKRVRQAIGFTLGVFDTDEPHQWSTRFIDKFFGVSSNPLSKYLRQHLLIVVNDRFRFNCEVSQCKTYRRNMNGVRYLAGKIGVHLTEITILQRDRNDDIEQQQHLYPIVLQVAGDFFKRELTTGDFEYKEISSRLHHPLQQYRRANKKQILKQHGYLHEYDIECCAFSLIYQHSTQIPEKYNDEGNWIQGPMDQYLPTVMRYLKDRTQFRKDLALRLEVDLPTAKRLVAALLAGARISRYYDSSIYKLTGEDAARIEFLKQDPEVQELLKEIKIIWDHIKPTMIQRTCVTKRGHVRKLSPNSKHKMSRYFDLERSVLMSVKGYLTSKGYRYFLEHDGWTTDREINQQELIEHVRTQTGFNIQLDYLKHETALCREIEMMI